jgi:transcriptional regulator with XRE-family HTH domain
VDLAERAGLSRGLVYRSLRGEQVSLEAALRIATALNLKLEWDLVDSRRRADRPLRQQDPVHSAMGELEAAHLRAFGYAISMDEPYQHFQFAGRADLAAWDLESLALLHIENRTRFPNIQEMAGSYNAKRAYLGAALAERLGVRAWRSETHVIASLWSAEVLHSLRMRPETFRALCPEDSSAFEQWWSGNPPRTGKTSTLVVLDPLAFGRQRQLISLDESLTTRPRHRGYAEAAARLLAR